MRIRYAPHILLGAVNLAVLFFLLTSQPVIHPDSASYIGKSLLRAPVYPLLLEWFENSWGPSFLKAVVAFQVIVATAGLAAFAFSLHRFFGIGPTAAHTSFTALHVLLLKFGTSILAEPLSFGIHAFFMAALVGHIFSGRHIFLTAAILISGLELLIRPQFLYVFVFLFAYVVFWAISKNKKVYSLFAIGILVVWFGVFLIRNSYNYIHFGIFNQYSAVGEHILATQLYIASPEDYTVFENEADSNFVRIVLERIDKDKATIHHWDQSKSHYNKSIEKIYFLHMKPVYAELFPTDDPNLPITCDAHCKKIGINLMKINAVDYAKLLFSKIYFGPFNYLCMLVILFILATIWHHRSKSPHALAYLAISSLTALNYGMLIPFALIVNRYTVFSDSYQILFTAICGLVALRGITKHQNMDARAHVEA
ncbi:MAG: hypothetical protein ABIK45_06495 [Pseudomonadota bacterium]